MANKHTHQYQRRTMGKDNSYVIYMCVLPNCGHYIPENLVVGRVSLCNYCAGDLLVSKEPSGKILHKPKCFKCKHKSKRVKKDTNPIIESFIERILS